MSTPVVNPAYWRLFHVRKGERVLDLGSGDGRHTIDAATTPCTVVAFDVDPAELRNARRRVRRTEATGQLHGAAGFCQGDAERLPFADATFDKVIATDVLECVLDDDRAMGEIYRVLKPDGRVVVSTPHRRVERLLRRMSSDYALRRGGPVRVYRRGELRTRMQRAGFQMGDEHRSHAYQSIYWFVRCAFGAERPNFPLTRVASAFIDWHLRAGNALFEGMEAVFDSVIPRDVVLYGKKPG